MKNLLLELKSETGVTYRINVQYEIYEYTNKKGEKRVHVTCFAPFIDYCEFDFSADEFNEDTLKQNLLIKFAEVIK